MEPKQDRINVSIRIRPVLNQDASNSSSLQIISHNPPVLVVADRAQIYHFDNIFSEIADQEAIYHNAVEPFVNYVKQGYNVTVFAYGQTGTGKTYTMGSGPQEVNDQHHIGIIPRALEQLFNQEHLNADEEIDVSVSFSEIYNEKVFDLLQSVKKFPLPVSGFIVQGLTRRHIQSVAEATELLELGSKNRHIGETRQNMYSSRSHAIFTVYYSLKNSSQQINGKLNLVDLAGSESVRKTGSKGSTFQEGININKGLLSIGQVISALSMKSSHVPYRQSMITSILQGSLNVDNYISLIACVSGNRDDITETLQTLDFAHRAKKVRSNPEINQVIAKYKKENFSRTPMKRPNSTPLKTPAIKRIPLSLPQINESAQSLISNVENSKSHFTINVSGVSSRITPTSDITQQALSPVIRKYMTKMEASIMDRLETVIISTLRRPTRASLLAEKSRRDNEKENTPLQWSKIQNEVSKMVKDEIAQMTVKAVRATSSPIECKENPLPRRLLNYDSPDSCQKVHEPFQKEIPFKVPQIPFKKRKLQGASKLSLSPIENEMPKITPRRSIRLSLKKTNNNSTPNTNNTLNLSEVSCNSTIENKKLEIRKGPETNDSEISIEGSKNAKELSSDSDFEKSPQTANRRSIRLARKKTFTKYCSPNNAFRKKTNINFSIAKTPSKVLVERALKRHKTKQDSPYTAHSKKVLKLLNEGTQREVEKLHSVGVKTAEQILLFRKFKGNFGQIEELLSVPGWGKKKFEKFVSMNFLRKE